MSAEQRVLGGEIDLIVDTLFGTRGWAGRTACTGARRAEGSE
jgi:hypothetical protein